MPDQQPAPPEPSTSNSGVSFVEQKNIPPVIFALSVLVIVFVLYQILAGTATVFLVGAKVTRESVTSHRFLTMIGQILFIFAPTLLFSRLLSTRFSDVFPWRTPKFRETLFALLGLLFLQQIFQIYLFFQDRLPLPQELENLVDPVKRMVEEMFKVLVGSESIGELVFVMLVVALVPSIVEELLFRGLVQSSFQKVMTPLKAAIYSGIIFGAFHFNPFALVPLMILGCYFGFLRMRSNSVLLAMTAHLVNNALAVIVVYFNMEEEMFIGGRKDLDPNIPAILSELFLFVVLFVVSFVAYVRATTNLDEMQPKM